MTQRQTIFAREVVANGNASEAYRRAYPRARTWKPEAVHQHASRLLKTGKVQARVAELCREADGLAMVRRRLLLDALYRIVLACPTDLLRPDGTLDMDKLRAARQEVQEITVEDTPAGRRQKVRFRDAIAAAARIAQMEGWDKPQQIELKSADLTEIEALKEAFRAMTVEQLEAWVEKRSR